MTRELDPTLQSHLEQDAIKVIFGPRRSGKSCLAIQAIQGRSFAYFNFEDESITLDFTPDQLIAVFAQIYPNDQYILVDEIQLLPRWEHLVNRLQRLGQRSKQATKLKNFIYSCLRQRAAETDAIWF